MKRRGLIVLGSLVVLAVLAWVVLLAQGPSDPVYQGKPLSYWLRGYVLDMMFQNATSPDYRLTGNAPKNSEASEAMDHIGTNAIPMLLQWLRAKDSHFKLKLVRLAQRQRVIPVDFVPAPDRNNAAGWWFNYLAEHRRKEFTNAIPVLIQIYQEDISEYSRRNAAYALVNFGRAAELAVPVLIHDLGHTNANRRIQSLDILAQIRARPDLCVPAIAKLQDDPSKVVRDRASAVMAVFVPDTNRQPRGVLFVPRSNAPASPTNAVDRPK